MRDIKQIGQLCRVDNNGFIINDANLNKVNAAFNEAIHETIERYLSFFPKEILSIYIRGSVPRGLGIEGISDLDTIAITYSHPNTLDLDWVDQAEKEIDQQFSILNGIELSFYHLEQILDIKQFSIIPFMLKTHSICVYGKNLK